MEFRRLGESGLELSVMGLGCNNFGARLDEDGSRAVIEAALDAGVTHFDTADTYGKGRSEEIVGSILGKHRDEVVIATKFGHSTGKGRYDRGGSRRYVARAVEASLRRLGTGHIDLYYLHSPDPKTPIEETLSALDDMVRQGKVRYIASSNMPGWQVVEAAHVAWREHTTPFVGTQAEWSLLNRKIETELVPACRRYSVGIVPFFPLASGMLTGKYREGEAFPEGSRFRAASYFARQATPVRFRAVRALESCARELGRTVTGLALGWLVAKDGVTSVPVGASSPEQVASNAELLAKPLTDDEFDAVERALASAETEE